MLRLLRLLRHPLPTRPARRPLRPATLEARFAATFDGVTQARRESILTRYQQRLNVGRNEAMARAIEDFAHNDRD